MFNTINCLYPILTQEAFISVRFPKIKTYNKINIMSSECREFGGNLSEAGLADINAKCQITNTIFFPMGTLIPFGMTDIIKTKVNIIKHICVQNGWSNLVKHAMKLHKKPPKGSTDTLTADLLYMFLEDGEIIQIQYILQCGRT